MLKAFNSDFRSPENEYTKAQKEEADKKQLEQKEKEKVELEAEQQKEEEYRQRKESAEAHLFSLTEDKKAELQQKFIKENQDNTFLMSIYNKFGFSNPIIYVKWVAFINENIN